MKSILEELWYGNICLVIYSRTTTPGMKKLMEYIEQHHNSLLATITNDQKEVLEKFDDCWNEYVTLSEKAIFVYVFKLGARLAIEIMSSAKE